jgi:hypothetical protein
MLIEIFAWNGKIQILWTVRFWWSFRYCQKCLHRIGRTSTTQDRRVKVIRYCQYLHSDKCIRRSERNYKWSARYCQVFEIGKDCNRRAFHERRESKWSLQVVKYLHGRMSKILNNMRWIGRSGREYLIVSICKEEMNYWMRWTGESKWTSRYCKVFTQW